MPFSTHSLKTFLQTRLVFHDATRHFDRALWEAHVVIAWRLQATVLPKLGGHMSMPATVRGSIAKNICMDISQMRVPCLHLQIKLPYFC